LEFYIFKVGSYGIGKAERFYTIFILADRTNGRVIGIQCCIRRRRRL